MRYCFRAALLVLIAATMSGCGGCGKRKERPELNRSEYEEEPAAPVAGTATVAPAAASVVQPAPVDEEEPLPAPVKAAPPKPKRPDDLAAWQADDIRAAAAENDRLAPQAILLFAKSHVGEEDTARMLIGLIEANEETTKVQSAPSGNSDDDEWTVPLNSGGSRQPTTVGPAVVAGLAINGAAMAEDALKAMLRGKFKSKVDDRTLALAAIDGLVQNIRPSYERMLLAVLTLPEQVRPEGQGALTAAELQAHCWRALEPVASASIRRSLALHLVDDGTPESHRELMEPPLTLPLAANLDAQVILLGRPGQAEMHRRLRESIEQYAGEAIDRMMDVPTPLVDHRRQEAALRTEALALAAKALWGPELSEHLVQSLDRPDENAGGAGAIMHLLSSIPTSAARAGIRDALERGQEEMSRKFGADGNAVKEWRDPGLLLVLKSLPREQSPEAKAGDSKRESTSKKPTKSLTPGKAAAVERARKEREIRYAWLNASEKFIWSLNERFQAAALQQAQRAKRPRPRGASQSESGDDPFDRVRTPLPEPSSRDAAGDDSSAEEGQKPSFLPFELPEEWAPRATYSLDWPVALRGQLLPVEVAPMQVRYARIETSDRMTRAFNYFHRQLKSPEEFAVKRGRWLDSVTRDPETGLARSLDVFVYRTIDEAPASRDTVEDLVIEILMVEVPDPAGKRPAAAQAGR